MTAIACRSASTLLQERIHIEQWLSDVEYALRSIKVCGSALHCTGVHAGQLYRGCEAAGVVLDCSGETIRCSRAAHAGIGYSDTVMRLREARDLFRELLKETKAELKLIGGVRQLRLAIAVEGAHEGALAA